MKIISLDKIEVRKRQRTVMDKSALTELRESILSKKGLLHPPVCYHDHITDTYVLVAGERRLRAIQTISEAGELFRHDGLTITPGEIPVTEVTDLLSSELLEAELEENIVRDDLTWQDKTHALAAIHRQRLTENPKQTQVETAKEIATKGGAGGTKAIGSIRNALSQALLISEKLNDPKIANARNANEAQALIYKAEEEELRSIIARRRLSAGNSATDIQLRHGDFTEILPKLAEGFVDLIIADPPYGVSAGSSGFRGRTVQHHNYADDEDTAREVASGILNEGFRVSKSRANLFLFCDIKKWNELRDVASRMGWEVFPRPIIWQKSETEGLAPWGRQGFRVTYETILYATKGQRGLITSPTDIMTHKRVSRDERTHAAEKPVDLLRELISCSTLPGDFVLDPCCGSGSTLVACRGLGRKGLGIEKDETYYNTAMSNVFRSEADARDGDGEEDEEGVESKGSALGGAEVVPSPT